LRMQQVIKELNDKPEIQVYSLLENNKWVIKELEKRSEVTIYLKHLNSLSSEDNYWIKFEWFNLAEGKINTTAIIESTNEKLAYEKTRDFVRNYRTDTWALLDLEFINLIEWNDTMKFDVSFKIK
jgi:phosphoserine aminotransferase